LGKKSEEVENEEVTGVTKKRGGGEGTQGEKCSGGNKVRESPHRVAAVCISGEGKQKRKKGGVSGRMGRWRKRTIKRASTGMTVRGNIA